MTATTTAEHVGASKVAAMRSWQRGSAVLYSSGTDATRGPSVCARARCAPGSGGAGRTAALAATESQRPAPVNARLWGGPGRTAVRHPRCRSDQRRRVRVGPKRKTQQQQQPCWSPHSRGECGGCTGAARASPPRLALPRACVSMSSTLPPPLWPAAVATDDGDGGGDGNGDDDSDGDGDSNGDGVGHGDSAKLLLHSLEESAAGTTAGATVSSADSGTTGVLEGQDTTEINGTLVCSAVEPR